MIQTISLSRSKINAFLNCQRQFQLRYLDQIAWPSFPISERLETAVSQGHRFHQLIEQSLNSLPIANQDPLLKRWWGRFEKFADTLPTGEKLIETTMTLPLSLPKPSQRSYLLNGRFDLLIIGQENDQPFAHLFDWKTGKPQPISALKQDWQTRLYLAMLAEGGSALLPKDSPPLNPDHIRFSYWYVDEPDQPRTIQYSDSAHRENWADLLHIAQQIDAHEDVQIWPLSEDWTPCRTCSYTIICQRQTATAVSTNQEDINLEEDEFKPLFPDKLEPERP